MVKNKPFLVETLGISQEDNETGSHKRHIARLVSSRVTSYPDLLLRQQVIWVRGNLEEASLFLELASACFLSPSIFCEKNGNTTCGN